MPIAIILTLMVGAGVSLAADGALPGDTFYPVKVALNERVRGFMVFSNEARVRWEARRAERRLEELEKLALRGEISAEAQARIEQNFEAHAERVQERIASLQEREDLSAAAEVSSRFETSLRAHQRILERMAEKQAAASTTVQSVLGKVRVKSEAVSRLRAKTEARISAGEGVGSDSRLERRIAAIERRLDKVETSIQRRKTSLEAEASAQAQARLDRARELAAQGKAKIEAGASGEAFLLFQEALRIAEEAELLIEARKELKVDIRLNGSERQRQRGEAQEAGKDKKGRAEEVDHQPPKDVGDDSLSELESKSRGRIEVDSQSGSGSPAGEAEDKIEIRIGL